jgi:RNA polymerase-associated protein CTR9
LSKPLSLSFCVRLFASLASASATMLPYSRELADQRRKYGDNMLKKAEEHLSGQRAFEAEKAEKLEIARRIRQGEKDKQEAAEVRSFCSSPLHAQLILHST